jgi:hypothetical protein
VSDDEVTNALSEIETKFTNFEEESDNEYKAVM